MNSSRAHWMKEARWGAFAHFLATHPTPEKIPSAGEWNAIVDAFDVEGLANQLEAARVRYFYLTIGQCSGHYCSPNAAYERITGSDKCSRRDLMADMQEALARRGIRFLAYLPSHGPSQDPEAMRRLKFTPPWDYKRWSPLEGAFSATDAKGIDERVTEGQRYWEEIIREWSLRWGDKLSGWWIDGCYFADRMYRHKDEPNFRSFAAAARAGNPDSILAWNPGVVYPVIEMDAEEDYTAGEIRDLEKLDHRGHWKGQEQYQVLTFLGCDWCTGPARFNAREAGAFVKEVNDYGGAVTWDVPIHRNGIIHEDAFEVLCGIEEELSRR